MTQKPIPFILFLILLLGTGICYAQSPVTGVWKTIDDETGEAKSHVEIYENEGKLYGKVVKLLEDPEDTVCNNCIGDKKDQPVLDMVILWDMGTYDDYWSNGEIMDPVNGKTYKCSFWLQDDNTLKVRGYIGLSFIGRNQFWYRIK